MPPFSFPRTVLRRNVRVLGLLLVWGGLIGCGEASSEAPAVVVQPPEAAFSVSGAETFSVQEGTVSLDFASSNSGAEGGDALTLALHPVGAIDPVVILSPIPLQATSGTLLLRAEPGSNAVAAYFSVVENAEERRFGRHVRGRLTLSPTADSLWSGSFTFTAGIGYPDSTDALLVDSLLATGDAPGRSSAGAAQGERPDSTVQTDSLGRPGPSFGDIESVNIRGTFARVPVPSRQRP